MNDSQVLIDILCETACDEALPELLKAVITHAVITETQRDGFELSLTITDDETIRQINSEHRNIDRATDVLSFPLMEFDCAPSEADFDDPDLQDPETGLVMLGDIVLSMDHVRAQAEEYGHSLEREACYLCVHSVLHLLGYDHMQENEKAEMRKHEESLLSSFDLTRE